MGEMKHWICERCGHEVIDKHKPSIKWSDAHVCHFVLRDPRLDEIEKIPITCNFIHNLPLMQKLDEIILDEDAHLHDRIEALRYMTHEVMKKGSRIIDGKELLAYVKLAEVYHSYRD